MILKANGKLLLSGEYLVLSGATALAFPVRFGQELTVSPSDTGELQWISTDARGIWFRCNIRIPSLTVLNTDNDKVAARLLQLLEAIEGEKPGVFRETGGYKMEVKAGYPLEYGLGSSSTLISLLSRWAGADAWKIYRKISNGSGYDLMCATRSRPFYYRLDNGRPCVAKARPGYGITRHSCFAWLGKKQDTATEVNAFLELDHIPANHTSRITELGRKICEASRADELCKYVREHENIIAGLLGKPTVQSSLFRDFPGTVKSLGAWGGDFAMFTAEISLDEQRKYLISRGLADIFTYADLKIDTR